MAWCQFDPLRWDQAFKRAAWGRDSIVHGCDHLFVLMGARDSQKAWVFLKQTFAFNTQAPGDDHAAVVVQCLANGLKTLSARAIDKAAGVDDHGISPFDLIRDPVALGAQFRNDALTIDQGFRAAKGDKAYGGI